MQKSQETDDVLTDRQRLDTLLSACILLACDLESTFKLYSYRVVDSPNFISRVETLIETFEEARALADKGRHIIEE